MTNKQSQADGSPTLC